MAIDSPGGIRNTKGLKSALKSIASHGTSSATPKEKAKKIEKDTPEFYRLLIQHFEKSSQNWRDG